MKIDMQRFGEAKDIKAELLAATAKAMKSKKTRLLRNRLIVGSYVASHITPGGIIKPQKLLDEDRYQGKVGLVLKLGPIAFKFDEDPEGKNAPKVGDWVLYRAADTSEIGIGEGAPCRVLYDDSVIMVVDDPKDYF